MSQSHAMSCSLPAERVRARGLGQHPDGTVRCTLPPATSRRAPVIAQAAEAPARVAMPMEYRRQPMAPRPAQDAPLRVALPMEYSRSSAQRPAASPPAPQAPGNGGNQPPLPRPGSEPSPSLPADPADQDRAALPVTTLLPIVEIVARGISGAAGYAYVGEEPAGAGVRFGMLGQRLDTGDMGAVLALARARDPQVFSQVFAGQDQELMSVVQAAEPGARKAPVNGAELWSQDWKHRLSAAGALPSFTAAQNEYAVEQMLHPAARLVLAHPALVNGAALAMALDALAECGRAEGLAKLAEALKTPPETIDAFQAALARAVPASARRLPDLARNPHLLTWQPGFAHGAHP